MKRILLILAFLFSVSAGIRADESTAGNGVENSVTSELKATEEATEKETPDLKEIIFEHLGDGYGWEVPFNHHKRMPLPVIVWGKDGLHVFSSSRVTGGEPYRDGNATFMIAKEGDYKGKIVEIVDGKEYKPWDLSITKNVCAIFIACIIVLWCCLHLAHWYKKNPFKAPRKFTGAFEFLVEFVYVGVIKSTLKSKAPKFAPYLLTVFFFIFTCNLIGLIPIFPGGANVTGNINITLFLAVCTMLAINLFGNKEYWKEIFWPDVPLFLKAYPVPIMPVIELFGVFTKPFALMIRLFANMMAGHAVILSFTCVIFLGWSMGAGFGMGLNVFSVLMMLFMNCLEVLVAFVQAYVFTMLSSVFIGLAHQEGHHGN